MIKAEIHDKSYMYTSAHLKVEWNKRSCTWKAVGIGYSEAHGVLRETQGIALLASLFSEHFSCIEVII